MSTSTSTMQAVRLHSWIHLVVGSTLLLGAAFNWRRIGASFLSLLGVTPVSLSNDSARARKHEHEHEPHHHETSSDAGDPVQHQPVHVPIPKGVVEENSFANFHECVVTHMSLNLVVNFHRQVLQGRVTYTAEVNDANAHDLVLDTRNITIRGVKLLLVAADGRSESRSLEYSLGEKHRMFGRALRIAFPINRTYKIKEKLTVEVEYVTSPGSTCMATHWLKPEQTSGKNHPYLFTHSAAVHCRSLFPCQDAPAVKTTYNASITVPTPLVALMSAPATGSDIGVEHSTYFFSQGVPLSSFLIALAVGDFESREIGPRSRVWAEASFVEVGADELSHTEECLALAEEILGPYVWGRFDLLILPPSFPWRGMANPCLTFVSPTLLAGDKSLVDVVAHEITHSWLGNLVTCSTWADFWLSKAFTVFVERKIVERLYGKWYVELKAEAGWNELVDEVTRFGNTSELTRLRPAKDTPGYADPDNFFSIVAAEKGCIFLWYLENAVGGASRFEPFLRAHMQRFQYGTVSAESWKMFFLEYYKHTRAVDAIDWDLWLDGAGMPPQRIKRGSKADRAFVCAAKTIAAFWFEHGVAPQDPELNSVQKIVFLQRLIQLHDNAETDDDGDGDGEAEINTPRLSRATLGNLDECYGFSETKNSEIKCLWCALGIRLQDPSILTLCTRFLKDQGRMKFVRRLYRDMRQFGKETGQQMAIETFQRAKYTYHAVANKAIEQDLLQ